MTGFAPAPRPTARGRAARAVLRLSAACLLAASLAPRPGDAAPAAAQPPRSGLVRARYDAPKDPAHRAMYERLRDRKMLEPFVEVIGALRLPRPLTLRFAGCDGEENAWYDTDEDTVTFCYELVAAFERTAAGAAQHGISREDAVDGPVVFFLLHEAGHAVFHLLQVPILGREEDAADQVAAFTLLSAGRGIARRAIAGAAWSYKVDASNRKPDESDFADVHGLQAQRFYNVLCMAYGSDPAAYAGMVEKGYLPKERAEGCRDEYAQVAFAVRKLISKSLDPNATQRTRERHRQRWETPPAAPPAAPERAGGAPAAPPPKR